MDTDVSVTSHPQPQMRDACCLLPRGIRLSEGNKLTFRLYMKKLVYPDWLRAMQFKCNISVKSVMNYLLGLIIYMKKLLDSDWLRAMQLK